MKQTGVVVGLCLACALAGAALAVALNTRVPEPLDDARDDDALERALEQLSVQLAVLDERLEIRPPGPSLAPRRPSNDPVAGAVDTPAGRGRSTPREARASSDDGTQLARSTVEGEPLPVAQRDRIRDIGEWQDAEVRASWLFVSQRGVMHALGMPDHVSGSIGTEYWTYRRDDQPALTVTFHAGRVIQMSP